jgi:hypothetical protein
LEHFGCNKLGIAVAIHAVFSTIDASRALWAGGPRRAGRADWPLISFAGAEAEQQRKTQKDEKRISEFHDDGF